MKKALVTGAGGGLGQRVVAKLSGQGWHVFAVDVNNDGLAALKSYENVKVFQADITDMSELKSLSRDLHQRFGGLDLLVCLAGIYDTFPVTAFASEVFNRMMSVNFLSTANVVQCFHEALIRSQGKVIIVSSESYKIQALFQPYMISKAALEAYCRVAWQELSMKGVRLSVIRPGAIDTPLLKWMKKESIGQDPLFQKEFEAALHDSKRFVGKISDPERVAALILKIALARKPRRFYRINNNPLLSIIGFFPTALIDFLIVKKIKARVRQKNIDK
ncbi:MAG: SDR family oxidoreductase [Bacteroidales bacterium]|jgi:NAD(P)-dependent dehydrogenase (short-subunit alcohol dehydrogenase family)